MYLRVITFLGLIVMLFALENVATILENNKKMDQLKNEISQDEVNLRYLKTLMDIDKNALDVHERSFSIKEYNELVGPYNAIVQKYNTQTNITNAKISRYNNFSRSKYPYWVPKDFKTFH